MHQLSNSCYTAQAWCRAPQGLVAVSVVVPRVPGGRRCRTRVLAGCAVRAPAQTSPHPQRQRPTPHQALLIVAYYTALVCLWSLTRRRGAAGAAARVRARAVRGGARRRARRPGRAADRRRHARGAAGRGRGSGRPRRRGAGQARARRRATARQARAQDARQGRPRGRGGGARDGGAGRERARGRWQRGRREPGGHS